MAYQVMADCKVLDKVSTKTDIEPIIWGVLHHDFLFTS